MKDFTIRCGRVFLCSMGAGSVLEGESVDVEASVGKLFE